jgi:hypothetical protein
MVNETNLKVFVIIIIVVEYIDEYKSISLYLTLKFRFLSNKVSNDKTSY